MPELIESHTISCELRKLLIGKIIININYNIFSSLRCAIGKTIEEVFSKGKKVIFKLNNGYIVTSLAMTGKYVLEKSNHTRVTIEYGKRLRSNILLIEDEIYYDDPRKFGSVIYMEEDEYNDLLLKLGPDILEGFSLEYWMGILKDKKVKNRDISTFLRDQSKIAGLGNYLHAEVLYNAKILPLRKISSLSDDEIVRLRDSIFTVVNEVQKCNGLSLGNGVGNYKTPFGVKGIYICKVYGQKTSPLGNKVIKIKKNKSAQSVYYVADEQF